MSSQSLGKKARAALDLAQDLKLDSALSSAKKLFLEFQSPEFSVAKSGYTQHPPTNLSTAKVDVENTKTHL
jgi:hypothetical protein